MFRSSVIGMGPVSMVAMLEKVGVSMEIDCILSISLLMIECVE